MVKHGLQGVLCVTFLYQIDDLNILFFDFVNFSGTLEEMALILLYTDPEIVVKIPHNLNMERIVAYAIAM